MRLMPSSFALARCSAALSLPTAAQTIFPINGQKQTKAFGKVGDLIAREDGKDVSSLLRGASISSQVNTRQWPRMA